MLDWLFPRRCVVCERPGTGLCLGCASELEPGHAGVPVGLEQLVVLCGYSGHGRHIVLALKRRNRRDAVPVLGQALADGLGPHLAPDTPPPTITWAPTTPARRRARGFDQAELLARSVARAGGWRVERLLDRRGGAQHGGSRSERLAGPTFGLAGRPPPAVVVVDDVVTTGATMESAARTLLAGGAEHLAGAVVATTAGPPGGGPVTRSGTPSSPELRP